MARNGPPSEEGGYSGVCLGVWQQTGEDVGATGFLGCSRLWLGYAQGAAMEEGAEEEPDGEGDPFGVGEVAGEGGDELHQEKK
jgi:hypothetical protein